jgi:tripartite-type tricarboxylate transporter receptor subunit TctC
MKKRDFLLALLCGAPLAAIAANTFPERPVHIVVAYPAGSTMDTLARLIAAEMQSAINAVFIVDNKPGAAGQIGAEFVAKSVPDGYTLFISGSSTHSANPSLYKQLRYDPVKDYTPIVEIATVTYALVVNSNLPVNNIADLARYAKTRPKGVSYAYGSQLAQISSATVTRMAGFPAVAVPYKGQPPAMTDLLGGQVDFMIADVPFLLPQIQGGKMRALAVLNNARSPLLPAIPTLKEQGLVGYDLAGWIGLSGPAGVPADIVKTLSQASAKVLGEPAFRARLSSMGMEYEPNSPAEFGQLVADQVGVWSRKVKDAGIQPE